MNSTDFVQDEQRQQVSLVLHHISISMKVGVSFVLCCAGSTATAGIPVPTVGFKPSLAAITEAHK